MASLLEIIAEGKIPQHFEERVMAAGVADVVQIVVLAAGANALLGGRRARVIALFLAQEHVLELVHPGVGEQQRGIVAGHKRRASDHAVATFGEIIEKLLADLGPCHR